MPPRRRQVSARSHPYCYKGRMARVPLGNLPFKQKNGELLCERERLIRPLPFCIWEDKENDDAAIHAAEQNMEILEDRINERHERDERERQTRRYINALIGTQVAQGPRLSMPQLDYDGSSSEPEPDDSILHGRARPMPAQATAIVTGAETSFNGTPAAADEEDSEADQPSGSPEEYEDENLSIEEEDADEDEDEDEDEEDDVDEEHAQDIAPLFDPATAGLKEVSNLARFTVSSHKPGNGVEELKSDDLKQFWQ